MDGWVGWGEGRGGVGRKKIWAKEGKGGEGVALQEMALCGLGWHSHCHQVPATELGALVLWALRPGHHLVTACPCPQVTWASMRSTWSPWFSAPGSTKGSGGDPWSAPCRPPQVRSEWRTPGFGALCAQKLLPLLPEACASAHLLFLLFLLVLPRSPLRAFACAAKASLSPACPSALVLRVPASCWGRSS